MARALTYYTQQSAHGMRLSRLPTSKACRLTSSHIESTIKQINQRIKGTEKFWDRAGGEAVLQLRADSLQRQPDPSMKAFWHRWQAQQTGTNRYQLAA